MLKPKSIQRATQIPINQCDRLRTLACFLSMAGRGSITQSRVTGVGGKIAERYTLFYRASHRVDINTPARRALRRAVEP